MKRGDELTNWLADGNRQRGTVVHPVVRAVIASRDAYRDAECDPLA